MYQRRMKYSMLNRVLPMSIILYCESENFFIYFQQLLDVLSYIWDSNKSITTNKSVGYIRHSDSIYFQYKYWLCKPIVQAWVW